MGAKDRSIDEEASFESDGVEAIDPAELDGIEFEAEGGRLGLGRKAEPHPADREHGLKTRGRSKQIVSGRPYTG